MRPIKHLTPRYVKNRLGVALYERTHRDAPWLTRQMVGLLSCWLRPDDSGLELGSGRSTIWFAERVRHLVSVEHDPVWYQQVQARLAVHKDVVDYHLCPDAAAYRERVDSLPSDSIDFVLVDGIERDYCAVMSMPKIVPGGIIIVDNCNWYLPHASTSPGSREPGSGPASETWGKFLEATRGWRYIWTSDGVTDTAFWVKPAASTGSGQAAEVPLRPLQ
ncbi:MAG: class I SAM-dependent methyltransferase [Acidobacteriia bacterium]|nr:class I SAM-dependent methyltransferase [Terriglobia bacterium]